MRQTNIFRLCQGKKKLMLCIMLLFFSCITSMLLADMPVQNVAVNTTFPGNGNKINAGGTINLGVSWQGDSTPFTAKFKKGSNILLSESAIQGNSTSTAISAASWGDTNGAQDSVSVEIVDNGGRSATGVSQSFIIDLTPPTLTATVTNNTNGFSQSSSVRIQITSNEEINAPTVSCNGVGATMEGSLTTGTSFVYNLQLNESFSNGQYTVNIEATDTSTPANSANRGTTTTTFTVGTSSSGDTKIESCNPPSPTNATSIALSGSAPNGVNTIKLLDGGQEVTSSNSPGTSWSLTIQPEEGEHNYVAVSYDVLNQEISRSSAYTVKIDRTAPSVPSVNQTESIPAQTNEPSYSFSVSVDGYENDVSAPVYLQAYNNGTVASPRINVTSSGSPVNVNVTLAEGTNNITFKTIDSAGNESESSQTITINKSGAATVTVVSLMVDDYSVPAPTNSMLGSGNHTMTIVVNQECNTDSLPTIEVVCAGGSKITVTPTWGDDKKTITGTFAIPTNGGAAVDGAATISIKDIKDTYGNTVSPYEKTESFTIDSTPPTSTFSSNDTVYVSSTNSTVNLSGTVTDNEGGSGIDFLELFENVNGTMTSRGRVPLQTDSPSPWTYSYNASELEAGEHTMVTQATDRALPYPGNSENITGKTGITLFVDTVLPGVERISFNNTGVDINTYPQPVIIASDITRIVAVASDTGSGPDLTSTNFIFTITGPNGEITGEKTNNGINTIYFDFPVLTASGDYTITVTPVDKAGNTGETQTRTFTLNKSAPDSAVFYPPSQSVANKTVPILASNSVRVELTNTATTNAGAAPSYTSSTISVKYNGQEVGEKNTGETTALEAILHGGDLKTDGSHDGNYYITVVPHSTTGVVGNALTSNFIYDTQPPVVIEASPSIKTEEIWFGLNQSELSITLSDAPKDIIENYQGQYPSTASEPVMPGDTSWYNGNGSGVNLGVSSFSWKMDSISSTEHSQSGTKLSTKRPTPPENQSPGVADVAVTMILADNVNQGETIPNSYTIEKTYKFDYLAPTITITTEKGKKYCKNVLNIKGAVKDAGDDENLQVVKLEYSETEGNWVEVTVDKLPSKSASFTVPLDISTKDDGTYTVKLRATDRAGNMSSEKEFTYVVDRTPPSAPDLTIPLSDYTVNKRSQSFKWTSVTDATSYLFQVSDDSSFNNVLNNQANTEYPGLKGFVNNKTDAAFSLPKDGTYYWRVAALEKCEDGFNISEYSESRKVIIDTVKPYILSVTPTPSSSNKVSTGMVTFTIRFNEPIDSTIDLTATLSSAGGQVMKIEKINCTGDTWVGTTVIPKNNSAVYDGNAIITVEGAADLAGNSMIADNSHVIVINTGPAFTTKIFSNPANDFEITIIIKSSESLQTAPSVIVRQNSVKTPVTMNFLKDKFYSGSYKIDKESPGSAYINISGTDLYGMVGSSIVEFIVADLNASSRLNITSASGRASLKAAESSTYTPTSIYVLGREMLETPFTNQEQTINSSLRASAGVRASVSQKKESELVGILGLDEVGPSTTKLKKCMLYTADVNGEAIDNSIADKIHIYRQDSKGNWIFQGGELKNYKISAQITGLGRLALMSDQTAPKMSSITPSNLTKLDTNYPEIKGQFTDNGSGLLSDSFKLYIDGLQVKNVEMNVDGSFSYKTKKPLKEGKHEIKCEVSDKAGNNIVRAVTIEAPAELRVGEFSPYPNPARGNRVNFAYNFGAIPESASLKIYDSAGHLVTKFGPDDFYRQSGIIQWDFTNKKGKKVANGTYIYRLEIVANGQKISKRGKFAILR